MWGHSHSITGDRMLFFVTQTPYEFVAQHLPTVGWGIIISFFLWLWKTTLKWMVGFEDAKRRAIAVEANVNLVATNHLAHIQDDMEEQTKQFKAIAKAYEKQTELLTSIDKNIALLVDRTSHL